MNYIRFYTAVLTASAAVHAVLIPRDVTCSTLVNTALGDGVQVSAAMDVATGALSVPSYSGGTILNSFPLCHVIGSVTYGDDGLTTDANGANTLTWELYLPITANYNGRFMVVGMYQ